MSLQKNLTRLYSGLVFDRPWLTLSVLILIAASFGYYAQFFRLDASADSLLLEGDAELEYSRQVNVRYGLRESVIVAYTPLEGELFSRPVLSRLQALRADLLTLPRVESVDSILNVPIFEDTPLTGISEDYLTLEQEIDRYITYFKMPNYQLVFGTRPLVFIFGGKADPATLKPLREMTKSSIGVYGAAACF